MANPIVDKNQHTFEKWLELEEVSTVRHEFYFGEVFAMAGETTNHNLINGNILPLYAHLHVAPAAGYLLLMSNSNWLKKNIMFIQMSSIPVIRRINKHRLLFVAPH